MDPSFLDQLIFKRLETAHHSVARGELVLVSALLQRSQENLFNHYLNLPNHIKDIFKVFSLQTCEIYTCENTTIIRIINLSIPSKNFPVPFYFLSILSQCLLQAITDLLSVTIDQISWHMVEFYIVASNSFLLIVEQYSIISMQHIWFMDSMVDGVLDCFQIGEVRNKAAMNMCVMVFVQTHRMERNKTAGAKESRRQARKEGGSHFFLVGKDS